MKNKPDGNRQVKKEMEELQALLAQGKLDVRRDPQGGIIPDDDDYERVEAEYPEAQDAEKHRLAVAAALIRAKEKYDRARLRKWG